ncbi:uncharacterized protein ACRADG_009911 isoform 2-T2 [Cochliomyia hominivorax]
MNFSKYFLNSIILKFLIIIFFVTKESKGEIPNDMYDVGDKIKAFVPILKGLQENLYKVHKVANDITYTTIPKTDNDKNLTSKKKILKSIIDAWKEKRDESRKTVTNRGTDIYVNNKGLNGNSYVYNIQNHGTHYHNYGGKVKQ